MIDSVISSTPPSSAAPTLERRWKEQVHKWSVSGLSKSAYCKSAGIDYHQMIYWSRKLAIQSGDETKKQNTPSARSKSTSFVAVKATPTTSELYIRLPNGIEIGGIQEQRLTHVIDLVIRSWSTTTYTLQLRCQ